MAFRAQLNRRLASLPTTRRARNLLHPRGRLPCHCSLVRGSGERRLSHMDLVYNRSRIEPQRSFFRLRKSSSWQGLFSISTNFFFVENLPAHTLVENGRRVSSSGFHRKTKNTALWLPAHLVAQNDNDVSSARVPSRQGGPRSSLRAPSTLRSAWRAYQGHDMELPQ